MMLTWSLLQDLVLPMALRMGVQLGVFTTINGHEVEGTTTQEIAEKAGASPIVVGMLCVPILDRIWYNYFPAQAKC